jgi:3-dehydroquinate synthase
MNGAMDRSFELVQRTTTRVVIGAGVRERLPALLRELGDDHVLLFDEAVGAAAQTLARATQPRATLALAGGERCKSLAELGRLASTLRSHGARRHTTLVALGGGSVTDLVGLLAAVFLRGVPFVACPTTTLALCDAALGGKNGVDHDGLKNELGTIRQPTLLLGDIDWLHTLPDARFREGFVEVVKKAAVLDAQRFARLQTIAPVLSRRDPAACEEAIAMAVAMKMAVVVADETERDRRRWLNFGHTIGHALESLAAGALSHGECVAIGMLAECRAAGVPATVIAALTELLRTLGAPTAVPRAFADVDRLWQLATQDKKAHGADVPMVVPGTLGTGAVVPLTRTTLASAIA